MFLLIISYPYAVSLVIVTCDFAAVTLDFPNGITKVSIHPSIVGFLLYVDF